MQKLRRRSRRQARGGSTQRHPCPTHWITKGQSRAQTRDYFILAANDDTAGAMGNLGVLPSRFQLFVTTAGMVSVITSILAGVLVGLAIQGIAAPPLPFTLACGGGMFLVAVAVHTRVQLARWERAERQHVVLFPSAGTER